MKFLLKISLIVCFPCEVFVYHISGNLHNLKIYLSEKKKINIILYVAIKQVFCFRLNKMRIKVTTVETELEFEIPDKSPGKKLFELVSRNVGIHELWFFGIFFSDVDDHNVWIDDSKKVTNDVSLF